MRIHPGSGAVPSADRGCVLTIGNFDGVHLGHRSLLLAVVERARELGRPAAVYTFDPHPRRVLQPERDQPLLMTAEQLAEAMAELGIDVLVRERFTAEFAALTAEAFLRDVIHRRIAPPELFVGRDFHFGKGRGGSGDTLAQIGPDLGIRVVIIPQVRDEVGDVSSTRIRETLSRGDVEEAARCLGRPYAIRGRVVPGERRGRTLGFPTANLAPENEMLPARGVYATTLRLFQGDALGARPHASVTNVGTRPTFEDGRLLVEAHLLGFDGDLYGSRVELAFHARIRGEQRFDGPEPLRKQIERDAARAAELLGAAR
jgi:riboflavin kinase/FMN adenylyltransferase